MEGGSQAAALEPRRTSRSSFTCELFDEAASDVADGGVTLLDTLRVSRGDIQEKINLAGELPTRLRAESHEGRAGNAPGFHSATDDVPIAARRQRPRNLDACDG